MTRPRLPDRGDARRCGDVVDADGHTVGNAGPCADGSACGRDPTGFGEVRRPFALCLWSRHRGEA